MVSLMFRRKAAQFAAIVAQIATLFHLFLIQIIVNTTLRVGSKKLAGNMHAFKAESKNKQIIV
jgi:hypothetical protein